MRVTHEVSMLMFFQEWGSALCIVIAAGICGCGFIAPFAATSRRLIFISPLAGVMLVPFAANASYPLLRVSYDTATLISGRSMHHPNNIGICFL